MAVAIEFTAGLADPVHDAQVVFRAVLEAMARPGTPFALSVRADAPRPMSPTLAAVVLTLLDQDVTAWISPSLSATRAVRDHLVFHTGARILSSSDNADFVLCASPREMPQIHTLAQGTPDYPDRSATVVVDCTSAIREGNVSARLTGPGIEQSRKITLPGFDRALWDQLRDNHRAYPLGVDLIVCLTDSVVCLPRSTAIEAT